MEDALSLPRLCPGMGGSDVSGRCLRPGARLEARICSDRRQEKTVFHITLSHISVVQFKRWSARAADEVKRDLWVVCLHH